MNYSHNKPTALQTLNYAYNIRNWLTNINDVSALGEDMFALGLGYTSGDNPQYNGNIAAMQWATKDFGVNTYNFNYDGANRITVADFSGTGSHNSSYSYDKNGNIMSLTRQGKLGASEVYGMIDQLTYAYNGNQLQSVHDVNDPNHQNNGFSDNGSFLTNEYTYDDNGNLLTDLNKSLSIAKYNHLNLPEQLNLNPPQHYYEISYLYTAAGQKLHKATHIDFTPATTTDYCGSFIYQDDQLQSILTPEGRVVVDDSNYEYQYFLKDHLGNTRITFNENKQIIQEDSYYPYGMNMSGLSHESGEDLPNKYRYNGKELQDDFGLDWYDFHARFYDPAIVRTTTQDPMAESFYSESPYSFMGNNPVVNIDPTGMSTTRYEDEQGRLILDTDDGSDAVVTVTDDKREGFDAAVKGTEDTDDVAWNNTTKKNLLGFELSGEQEGLLSQLNSDWSRKNAIAYWQNPTAGNAFAFAFSEALSQWTNPELVVAGLSAGVAGYSSVSSSTVYRVYGGDARAGGFSWTPKHPGKVGNFRNAAGLPSGGASGANNTGRFVIKGTVNHRNIIKTRSAVPLDGNKGGLREYIIDPKNVNIRRVAGVNPEF